MESTISTYEKIGIASGPASRLTTNDKTKRASTIDLGFLFYIILARVQNIYPWLIPETVNIEDKYYLYRSLRWGAISEAHSTGIQKLVIEADN